jgi:hypothetical protein
MGVFSVVRANPVARGVLLREESQVELLGETPNATWRECHAAAAAGTPSMAKLYRTPQTIDYAVGRPCFRSCEIRVLNETGNVERTIQFSEADRKL